MNKVILLGRLGSYPETRDAAGTTVTNFSLATTQKYKDKETTQWHRVTAWGKQGDIIAKYVKKGHRILLEGRIEYQEYEKDGVKRTATNIVLESFNFIESGGSSENSTASVKQQSDIDDLPF